jgi:hypothetical protein
VVSELWRKHCRPWYPGSGNLVTSLSDDEYAEAIKEAEALFAAEPKEGEE